MKDRKGAVGQGGRFAALKKSIEERNAKGPKNPKLAAKRPGGGKVENPGALTAFLGRKKYGPAAFQKMAAKGRAGA